MYTKITSIETLKQIWVEIFLNKTNKVTKVSDSSVLNGIAFGCAKVGQKAIKDIAILESHVFPDSAYDVYLDNVADNNGIAPRFGASGSSTYLRLVATPGTVYTPGINVITGHNGISFDFEEKITMGIDGFVYAKIRSQTTGEKTNVNALTLNKVNPIPTGHSYLINEYKATGGRDVEQDDTFRMRIKEGSNILARGTISMLEQVFMKINNNVLKVNYNGIDDQGRAILVVVSQNGADFSQQELNTLLAQGQQYFSLSEMKPWGTQSYGVDLQNTQYQPIDVSFRVELFSNYNADVVRQNIQINMAKKLDFRYWVPGDSVQWDDLLGIVKDTDGVKYVPDQYFYPHNDIPIDRTKLPRIRGFLMLNLNGVMISDASGLLNSVYYPNKADFSYQQTILNSI